MPRSVNRAPEAASHFLDTWPQFRGPTGMGIVPPGDWPTEWNARTGANVLWAAAIPGEGKSSPILWGDRIFLTSADMPREALLVTCVDRSSGAILWTRRFKAGYDRWPTAERRAFLRRDWTPTGWAAPTPATDGRFVYAAFATADVLCLNFDGRLIWRRNFGVPQGKYGLASSPILYEDLVIWQFDQGERPEEGLSALLALDKQTGSTVWRTPRPVRNSWASPVIGTVSGLPEVVTTAAPWVIAYDPATGAERWRAKGVDGDVGPSPIVVNGIVYIVSGGMAMVAITPGGVGDVTKTHTRWRAGETAAYSASPISDGRRVLEVGLDLICHSADDGVPLWQEDLSTDFTASPTLVGERVYLFGTDGMAYVFQLAESLRLLSTGAVGEKVEATPAFADGCIYIRGARRLFCIGK